MNQLLTPHQAGYRARRSTIGAVAELTDDTLETAEGNKLTSAVLIDFRKAFDCMDHNIFVAKLANFGFQPSTLKWFRTYIEGRQQRTRANGIVSDYSEVQNGVPQISILGPILYIIYINGIPDVVKESTVKLYADDTLIYTLCTDRNEMSAILNWDLGASGACAHQPRCI